MNKYMDDGEYIHIGGEPTTPQLIARVNTEGDVTMTGYEEVITYNRVLNSVDIGKDLKVKTEDDQTITVNEHGEFIKEVIDGLFNYSKIEDVLQQSYNFNGITYNKDKLKEDIFTNYRSYETEIPILRDDEPTFCNNPQKVKAIDYVYAIQDAGNSPEHLFCNYKLLITPGTIIDPAGKTKQTKKNQQIINIANNDIITLDENFIKKYALDSAIKDITCEFDNTKKEYNITIMLKDNSIINCTFDSNFKAIAGDKEYFQGNPYKNKYILDNFSKKAETEYKKEVKKYLLVKELGDTLQVAYLDKLLTYVQNNPNEVSNQFPELISNKRRGGDIDNEDEDTISTGFDNISRDNTYITTNDNNVLYRSLINNVNCALQQGRNNEIKEVVYRDLIPEEELKLLRKQKKEVIDDIINKNNNVIQLLKTIATGDNVDKITLDGNPIGYLSASKIDTPDNIKIRKTYMKNVLNYLVLCLELINKNIRTILELRTIVNVQYYDSFLKDCEKFLFSNPFEETINKSNIVTYKLLNRIQSMLPNIIGCGIVSGVDNIDKKISKKPQKLRCGPDKDYGYYDIVMNRYYEELSEESIEESNTNSKKIDETMCKNKPIENLANYIYDNYRLEDTHILDSRIEDFNNYIIEGCFTPQQIYGLYKSIKKRAEGETYFIIVSSLFDEIITTYRKKIILIHNKNLNPDIDLNTIDENELSEQEYYDADINIYEKNNRYIQLIKKLDTIFINYVNKFSIINGDINIFKYIGWYTSSKGYFDKLNSEIQETFDDFELVINPYNIDFSVENVQIDIPIEIALYDIKKIIPIINENKQNKEGEQNEENNINMEIENKNKNKKEENDNLICKMIYLDDQIKIQELIKNCISKPNISQEEINDKTETIYTIFQKLYCNEDTTEDIEDLKKPYVPKPIVQPKPVIPRQQAATVQPPITQAPSRKQPTSQKQVAEIQKVAEQQKAVAELQKTTSDQQKAVAELQKITSDQQKAVAEQQQKIAEQLIKPSVLTPLVTQLPPSTQYIAPKTPLGQTTGTQPSQQTPYIFGQPSITPRAAQQPPVEPKVTGQKRRIQNINQPSTQSKISSFFTRNLPVKNNSNNNSNNSMLGGGNDLVELSKSTNSMNYYMENNYTDSPGLFTYHMLCFFPRVIFLAIAFFKVIQNNSQLKVIFEKLYDQQPKQPQEELLQTLQNIAIELFDHETSVELNEVFLNMNDGPNYMYDMFEEDPSTQTQQIEERKNRYTNYDNITEYLCHFCYRLINDCQIEYDNNKLLLTDLQFINENLFEKSTIANEEELFNNFKDNSVYKYRLLEYYDLLFDMEYYITSTNSSKYMNTIRFVQFRIEDNIYIDPSIVSEEIVETAPPAAADTTPIKQAVEPSTTNMEVDEETEEEKRRTIIKQRYPSINDSILEQIEEQIQYDPRRTKFFTNDSTRDKMLQDAYTKVMTRTVVKQTPAPVPKTGRKITNTETKQNIIPKQLIFGGVKRVTYKKNKKHQSHLKRKTMKRNLKHLTKTSKKHHKKVVAKHHRLLKKTHKKRR
jgi:hypothetical protein